jgi:hypothetical protein
MNRISSSVPLPEGQLNSVERNLIVEAVTSLLPDKPVCLEVGTYKGGGSTLHILKALAKSDGILFGIEASQQIFQEMSASLVYHQPELCRRFFPVCGFSQKVIPSLVDESRLRKVNFAFLDGGNNPNEQIEEFFILDSLMPVGSILMSHDAFLRKGKFLRRILPLLDHWQTEILPVSTEGLLVAKKVASQPTNSFKAKLVLFLCRLSPLELAAKLSPHWFRSTLFRALPQRLTAWIADGRSF